MGGAGDLGVLLGVERHDADDVLGAGIHAGAAGHALVKVHLGHAVHDVDGVELTGVHAVAAAQAPVGALQGAGRHTGDSQTALQTNIVIAGLIVTAAGTHDLGDLAGTLFHGHAHDLTDLGSSGCAAGRAGIDGSGAGHHSAGVAAAAGIAAAAAVCAGQDLNDRVLAGVLFHGEDLRGHCQDGAKDDTQYRQDDRG